ncbi:membrane anchoring protein efr3a [Kappamyces sp. JEL0680]|nr:membrane anchoring protein efr3a [Kappamyces sp. JEL0680]
MDLRLSAPQTFTLFSSVRNPEDVIDAEFSLIHSQLIKTFCKEASSTDPVIQIRNKLRLSGLKALESLCEANFFVEGNKIDDSLEPVLRAILINLNSDKTHDAASASPSLLPSLSAGAGNVEVSQESLKQIAEKCLVGICKSSNAVTLKPLVAILFKILESNNQLEEPTLGWDMLSIVISSSESQYHFVIISYVLELIDSETNLVQKTTLIKILQQLIMDQRLAGLTIPELLDTFVKHLVESTINGAKETTELTAMQVACTEAIGSLAAHLAYPNQINEILSFLVNRAQFEKKSSRLEKHEQTLLFFILLSLVSTIKNNGVGSGADEVSTRGPLAYNIFVSLLTHFYSPMQEIRLQLYYLLSSAVNACRNDPKSGVSKLEFQEALRLGLSEYALSPTNQPLDYVLLGNLLCNSLTANSPLELGYAVPLLFYLQKQTTESAVLSAAQKRALASCILEYFAVASKYVGMPQVAAFVESTKQSRIDARQWCPAIMLTDDSVEALRHKSFA